MSLYAVSIDPPAESKVFAERIAADGRGAVRFPLLSDAGHRVIDAYRLRDTAYDGKEYEGIPPSGGLRDRQERPGHVDER